MYPCIDVMMFCRTCRWSSLLGDMSAERKSKNSFGATLNVCCVHCTQVWMVSDTPEQYGQYALTRFMIVPLTETVSTCPRNRPHQKQSSSWGATHLDSNSSHSSGRTRLFGGLLVLCSEARLMTWMRDSRWRPVPPALLHHHCHHWSPLFSRDSVIF